MQPNGALLDGSTSSAGTKFPGEVVFDTMEELVYQRFGPRPKAGHASMNITGQNTGSRRP